MAAAHPLHMTILPLFSSRAVSRMPDSTWLSALITLHPRRRRVSQKLAAEGSRSFVEQAAARCSVSGSRLWFSCNPESPAHWFYQEWVLKAEEKNALRIRFSMEDNPGLSPQVRARYANTFQGAFYRRFVLGEWVAAEGLVYDFFDESLIQDVPEGPKPRSSHPYRQRGKTYSAVLPAAPAPYFCSASPRTETPSAPAQESGQTGCSAVPTV